MCKTCEQPAEKLRMDSAYEHNLYPSIDEHRTMPVRKPQVIRTKSHTFSLSFPTAILNIFNLLISQLSTSSTGLINTITK